MLLHDPVPARLHQAVDLSLWQEVTQLAGRLDRPVDVLALAIADAARRTTNRRRAVLQLIESLTDDVARRSGKRRDQHDGQCGRRMPLG